MEGLKKNEVQNLRMLLHSRINSSLTTEVESPNLGDAKEAQKMVEIMKDCRFDPREVSVLQSKKCATSSICSSTPLFCDAHMIDLQENRPEGVHSFLS